MKTADSITRLEHKVLSSFRPGDKYSEAYPEAPSSLGSYFKSIRNYSSLNEEEERNLGKQIKDHEDELKTFVLQWLCLFKKEFLKLFSAYHKKKVQEIIRSANASFQLFETIEKWEKDRQQTSIALENQTITIKKMLILQDRLNKIEAELSKCIAGINLTKPAIIKTFNRLRKIPHHNRHTRQRQPVEKELRKMLRGIIVLAGNIKALKSEFIHSHQRLVISTAKKYLNNGLPLSDLIQEGNLGLMRAVDTYDYRRGNRFITYAIWWIRQSIIRAIDCSSTTIRKPVYIKDRFKKVLRASNQLQQARKREPTREEIAEETQLSLAAVEELMQNSKDTVSMQALMEEHGDCVITTLCNYKHSTVIDHAISSDLAHAIEAVLSNLPQREMEIVKLRYGIGTYRDHSLEEIGNKFDLSRERVRQILEETVQKLRTPKNVNQLKEFVSTHL